MRERSRGQLQRLAGFSALLLLVSCEAGEPSASGLSAGQPDRWALAAEPDFLVPGGVFNGDSVQFFGVSDAEFAPDGNAVIALGRSQNTVIVLDGGGQIVQVLGGAGDGPKELRSIPQLHRVGGRLVVFDRTRRRYLEIVGSAFADAVSYERGPGERELGLLDDGSIFTTLVPGPAGEASKESQGVTPYYVRLGAAVDTIAGPSSPPEPALIVGTMSNGGTVSVAMPQCLPENLSVSTGSVLLIADAGAGIAMALSRTGTLDTLYQSQERDRVTQAMLDGAQDLITLTIERARRLPESSDIEFHPDAALERIGKLGDPVPSVWSDALWDGRLLWLRHDQCFPGAEQVEPSLWDAVEIESGSRVAVVEMPASLRLFAASSERVLAVSRDGLDVERVGVFRIAK